MACDCPEIILDPFENIDPCLSVVTNPTTCEHGLNNVNILNQVWETLLLLRCQYIASGASAIKYRYQTNLVGSVNNIVLPDAGILTGVDPNNCFLRINGVNYLHISLMAGNRRYSLNAAADQILFFDENNNAILIGPDEFIDFVIFRA